MIDDMTGNTHTCIQLTCLFEYRSGKSHINVAVSPVLTEIVSEESSDEKINEGNKSKI